MDIAATLVTFAQPKQLQMVISAFPSPANTYIALNLESFATYEMYLSDPVDM